MAETTKVTASLTIENGKGILYNEANNVIGVYDITGHLVGNQPRHYALMQATKDGWNPVDIWMGGASVPYFIKVTKDFPADMFTD